MSIDWSGNPEATHFDPVDHNFLREVGSALLLFNKHKGWTSPVHTSYGVTIEDCNRPLIKRPEWNGEGRPPRGIKCEAQPWKEHDAPWAEVEFIADWLAPNGITYSWVHTGYGWKDPQMLRFRPIRTAEQIAAEAHEKAIAELAADTDWILDRNSCEAVLAAGYRKQETAQ